MCVEEGDTIQLEINGQEVYEGTVYDKTDDRIEIINVLQYSCRKKLNGVYSFFFEEITNVKVINQKCKSEVKNTKVIAISEEEYYYLQRLKTNYIYIDRPDARYFTAIGNFKKSDHVYVAAVGLELSRSKRTLKMLVVSTVFQVYIFDFRNKSRNIFPEGLRLLFQSVNHKKIIYNGMNFIDYLLFNYSIKLNNVLDLSIFNLNIMKMEGEQLQHRSLSNCLELYINLVPGVVKDICELNKHDWSKFDLSDSFKIILAELVVFLIPLKRIMMEKIENLAWTTS